MEITLNDRSLKRQIRKLKLANIDNLLIKSNKLGNLARKVGPSRKAPKTLISHKGKWVGRKRPGLE